MSASKDTSLIKKRINGRSNSISQAAPLDSVFLPSAGVKKKLEPAFSTWLAMTWLSQGHCCDSFLRSLQKEYCKWPSAARTRRARERRCHCCRKCALGPIFFGRRHDHQRVAVKHESFALAVQAGDFLQPVCILYSGAGSYQRPQYLRQVLLNSSLLTRWQVLKS